MGRPRKKISPREKKFAQALAQGYGSIEAARSVFGWKCQIYTQEAMKAKDLARADRIKVEVARVKKELDTKNQAQTIITTSSRVNIDNLRQFGYDRLIEIVPA